MNNNSYEKAAECVHTSSVKKKWDRTRIERMTLIRTDTKQIRENPYNQCHTCSN